MRLEIQRVESVFEGRTAALYQFVRYPAIMRADNNALLECQHAPDRTWIQAGPLLGLWFAILIYHLRYIPVRSA